MSSSSTTAAATLKTESSAADVMHPRTSSVRKKKNRFTDQQIKSLEIVFESDSRPEPQTKEQIAAELGLQPRQVSIWFQNKRARSRSKQIEQDYCLLKSSYDTLASSFESLKTENRALLLQIKRLKSLLGKLQTENKVDQKPETAEIISESKNAPSRLLGSCNCKAQAHPSNHISRNVDNVEKEADISSVNWCSLESSIFGAESSCSQWWEYWS
ncbi:hypothetical protein FNV43_RR25293 [Rhamnella rubrinervis]|uniref:Homeobox-leucine zipper protein n=1 Tax=Rhamnella rubrinervis TaxID=2594499 RepID=A0A8K0DUT9_9ROSA|nr:hypothetical protein FNV43_RR25293 [Rhamnella rubrinervis]